MEEYVKIDIVNKIGIIEFFHPQSNSLPNHILSQLANTITNAGEDDNIKVIILKSAEDRAFCAGASFDELIGISNAEEGKIFFSGFCQKEETENFCCRFIFFINESARRHPQHLEVLQYQGHVQPRSGASTAGPQPRLKQIT